MQQIISQVVLPIILAAVMIGVGLGLRIDDFKALLQRPKAMLIGLFMQIAFLPMLALFIIWLVPLPFEAAAGLFLVSLCPGGSTSNLFTFIAKGNLALSVTLTGFVSILSTITLPLIFVFFLTQYGASESTAFSLPIGAAIVKLSSVVLVPTFAGMLIRHFAQSWALSLLPLMKKLSMIAMGFIIIALIMTNSHILPSMISNSAIAVLLLSTLSLVIAYVVSGMCEVDVEDKKTIAIEVGVQNAGTAMLVAMSIMHQPVLGVVPLLYGLLMNIPAFTFVYCLQKFEKTGAGRLSTN